MKLSGEQRKQFQQALTSAFPSESALEQMLMYQLSLSLNTIAGGSNFSDTVFNLVKWAESHGRTKDIVDAARKENPGNSDLREFAEQYKFHQNDPSPSPAPEKPTPANPAPSPESNQITLGFFTYPQVGEGVHAHRILNWAEHFATPPEPSVWTTKLFPELQSLYTSISHTGTPNIKLHPRAHITAGIALGYVFRNVTGSCFEIEQRTGTQTQFWRSDVAISNKNPLKVQEQFVGEGDEVSLELSITRPVELGATNYIKAHGLALKKRVTCTPMEGIDQAAIKDNAHALEMAHHVQHIINTIRGETLGTIHLFATVPFALAVFIGMYLNKCPPILCYEYFNNEYVPSCPLESSPGQIQLKKASKRQLTMQEINQLVDLLLKCPSIQDKSIRNDVLAFLPDHVRNAINRRDQDRADVVNIVRTCNGYPDALETLIDSVRCFDKGSLFMQSVDEFWQGVL